MPTDAMLAEVYATYGYDQEDLTSVPPFIFGILEGVVGTFERHRGSRARLLDVGFGAGALLKVARDQGWSTFGIEASSAAVEQGRRYELGELTHGNFLEVAWADGSFDVIVMTELIEHLVEPGPFLRQAARLLRPGGLLYMTTPHGRGISGRLLGASWSVLRPPEHLQLYSIASMKEVLRRAGFSDARIYAQGVLPHEILAYLRRRLPLLRRGDSLGAPAADVVADASAAAEANHPDRVQKTAELNATITGSQAGRLAKSVANGVLRTSRLGDSLRVYAER
ncbi:MAG: class I SAM-dependent methyltransferase [Deltaproteobacteria bacterium]|nr:class I SAM-dependent methyltransferase [Deltaproteobacteria bacterium]